MEEQKIYWILACLSKYSMSIDITHITVQIWSRCSLEQ